MLVCPYSHRAGKIWSLLKRKQPDAEGLSLQWLTAARAKADAQRLGRWSQNRSSIRHLGILGETATVTSSNPSRCLSEEIGHRVE
jgi:hypothetical protein